MDSEALTYEGFQDREVFYPYYLLTKEIGSNDIVQVFNKIDRIFGISGCYIPSNRLIRDHDPVDEFSYKANKIESRFSLTNLKLLISRTIINQ